MGLQPFQSNLQIFNRKSVHHALRVCCLPSSSFSRCHRCHRCRRPAAEVGRLPSRKRCCQDNLASKNPDRKIRIQRHTKAPNTMSEEEHQVLQCNIFSRLCKRIQLTCVFIRRKSSPVLLCCPMAPGSNTSRLFNFSLLITSCHSACPPLLTVNTTS